MNNLFKIAAGILGGVAIIVSLGGFSRGKGNKQGVATNDTVEDSPVVDSSEIPDDILDGNNVLPEKKRGERIRRETEENVRSLQEGIAKASHVLGHISTICNSILKMFYEDPCVRITPTTYII